MDDIASNSESKIYEISQDSENDFSKTKSSVLFTNMSIEENKKENNNELNSSFNSDSSTLKIKKVDELLLYKDIKNFDPEEFCIRRYNKNNINAGKIFFKYRYIKRKIEELSVKKSIRMSTILNIKNLEDITSSHLAEKRLSVPYFNLAMNNSIINKNEDMFNDKDDFRTFNGKFLTIVEKSIIHFNLKKYDESFKVLYQEKIIDSEIEFGEFLLVKSGYDKNILGSFLAKDKPPNKNKEVINGFINSIDLKYYEEESDNNYFLECLRFLLSRLNLPQDANMILQIMDTYSNFLFNNNKDDKYFISKYSSIDAIYLLISTLLALNTMFTRKDIKNMNMITIQQFLEMNKDIEKNEAKDIYEKLEKNPISMSYNYSDIIYQKMAVLVKENCKKNANKEKRNSITSWLNDNNFERESIDYNIIIEEEENTKVDQEENENLNESENNSFNENINIEELAKINSRKESTYSIKEAKAMRKYNSSLNFNNNKIKRKSLFEQNLTMNNHLYKVDDDIRQISFSYRENLQTFSDKDISTLTTPTKFIKLISKNSHHIRVFVVDRRMDKLKWAKEIEVKINSDQTTNIIRTKGTVHTLMISEIEDVYNGIGKSQLIKDYIKKFPNEKEEANNFITIKAATKSFCIKAYDQETGLSWFKALKSLIIHNKGLNKKNIDNKDIIKKVKNKIKNIWKTHVIHNWEKYGNYLFYKAQNKINFIKKQRQIVMTSKNGLLESKKTLFSIETINSFLTEAINKLTENNYFDYNEFLYFYSLGLPSIIRGKIWTSLIGNPCGININLYKAYSDLIAKIDFIQLLQDYEKNNNIDSTLLNIKDDINNDKYTISQILLDIINIKDNFLLKDTKDDINHILSQVYIITRVFFLMRPDIMYNKSLVAFSFIFILVCKDEYASFYNIFNLICSTNLLQYYKKNENYIDIRVKFFDELLENRIPKVSRHFKNLDISTELYLVSWFGNIFSFTLEYHLLRRIFDLYLLHGEYILFQVGLTIIKIQEDELLNCTISDVFRVLGRLPDEYKEDIFLEKMYLNNIYSEYEIWKTNRDLEKQKSKFDFSKL